MHNQDYGDPPQRTADALQRDAFRAHENLGSADGLTRWLRPPVRESWQRSLRHHADPDEAVPQLVFTGSELAEYRTSHPLAAVMPVIRRLLVRPGTDTGLLVAVGDELGRLLWVEGDDDARRLAERMLFIPGTDWSERSIGTSAPGTALASGQSVQIIGAEHFSRQVHSWSCTAVPVHDPDTGTLIGVVDITGRDEAVAAHTLALVEATVAAAESQLKVERLQEAGRSRRRRPRVVGSAPRPQRRNLLRQDSLQILGRDPAVVNVGGRPATLSTRHAELLTLLALHPAGLTADELSVMVYPESTSVSTVRAEMLRLRNLLGKHSQGSPEPPLVPQSRPYRLPHEVVIDAKQVLGYLENGAYRLALGLYRGPVLPRSDAPAITALRSEVSMVLREAMLSDAGPDSLLEYLALPEGRDDVEAWSRALRLLPERSPRKASIMAGLQRIEAELG
ncbi:GAF domain-containing protein [Arthrobacter sp. APC 3897]|uniref:helix-turn-helix domain-containing protein n=1 Tax=Arthrobacter sp. APC 3897 TaxID=3035204 RepID=UPI0025B580D4|nr:helix-turn-helix domain-containing protein [Arthrobacter sp. APC 3897]MDN3483309.1 GAF domain-containing protein [Arthrobacter sp. APC 3897]